MLATIIHSPYDHPYYHLSLEEYLLKKEPIEGPVVLFYINRPSVIIGRNQNPWREANIGAIQKDQVVLCRRMTGGGTVFHDYGNLNYAVIYQYRQFSDVDIFNWLLKGFAPLQVHLEVGKRKELLLNGLKISGTAFGRYQNRVIQHGTLLVSADLSAMDRYLTVNPKIEISKAVKSVPSKVMNLQTFRSELDAKRIVDSLACAMDEGTVLLPQETLEHMMGSYEYLRLLDKHQSWKWIFGETPDFSLSDPLNEKDRIEIQRGKVVNGSIEIDQRFMEDYPALRVD